MSTIDAGAPPGWYVKIDGDEWDLEDWRDCLNEPFDPVALKLADDTTVLASSEFAGFDDASDVRERGLMLIARLNGALGLSNSTRPVTFGGVVRIDEKRVTHRYVFGEAHALGSRAKLRAVAVVLGADGKPLPPPPPEPSIAQRWNELATKNDDVSDLLDHFGRADNWYDIYKTVEIAAHLVGGKHKLWRLAAPEVKACRNLDQTANFYRHARGARRPEHPVALNDAKRLLSWLVRKVLDSQLASVTSPAA